MITFTFDFVSLIMSIVMKTLFIATLVTLPFLSRAQQNTELVAMPDNGVYLSANDFANRVVADGFDDSQPGYHLRDETLKNAVKITRPNEQALEIPVSNVWGERKQGTDYRDFDGDIYRVEHADRIYLYSKPVRFSDIGGLTSTSSVQYYFSREANSPIHLITADNLKEIYYDQPERTTAFEQLELVNGNPARRAAQLVRLFYTTDSSNPPASKAD